jgi:hypothetical protein
MLNRIIQFVVMSMLAETKQKISRLPQLFYDRDANRFIFKDE